MARGRPADPTRERRGTGNRPKVGTARKPKASELVALDPAPVVDAYAPPETLPETVHEVWKQVVADLGGANNLRQSYLPSLLAYCEAVHVHAQASESIHKYGVLVKAANGTPIPNPLLKVQKDAAATMLRLAETLGLTPAARIRLGLMEITGMSLLSTIRTELGK